MRRYRAIGARSRSRLRFRARPAALCNVAPPPRRTEAGPARDSGSSLWGTRASARRVLRHLWEAAFSSTPETACC